MATMGFLSHYLSGPLPYVQCHIALVCSALGYSVNESPLKTSNKCIFSEVFLCLSMFSGSRYSARKCQAFTRVEEN